MARNGIDFLGKNSYRDFNVTIKDRVIGHPSKRKIKEEIPFSNQVYDFSSVYGPSVYTERTLTYRFNIANQAVKTKEDMTMLKTLMVNWLFNSSGKEVLRDPYYPNYYFLVEAEDAADFKENWLAGTLDIDFTAYPFMIADQPEGNDLWDTFNFNIDVVQPTKFQFKSYWDTFNELKVGDYATYGAWATRYIKNDLTGNGGHITPAFHGATYKIVDKDRIKTNSHSDIVYKLENHDEWVTEQDMLQAQTEYLDLNLINVGPVAVTPEITTNQKASIVRGNEIFNLQPGQYKTDDFVLNPGDNRIRLYIANVDLEIDFKWFKELI